VKLLNLQIHTRPYIHEKKCKQARLKNRRAEVHAIEFPSIKCELVRKIYEQVQVIHPLGGYANYSSYQTYLFYGYRFNYGSVNQN